MARHDLPGDGHDHDAAHAKAARERVWLSARTREGLDLLRDALGARLGLRRVAGEVQLPPGAGRLRARLHELGAVLAEHHDEHGWTLSLDLAEADAARIVAHAYGEPLRPLLLEGQGTPT